MELAPLLELESIGKTYANGAVALENVGLHVAPGEFVSLLGPSGCGKSTLLRLIAGLDVPTTGRVRSVEQAVQGGRSASARDRGAPSIGCVFQEPTLLPWCTAWDNVYLPLRLLGRSRSEAATAVDSTLALVGLEGFAKAYPRELSGGMKMRVSVARALVSRPGAILLDEPFAALDEITRHRLNDDLLAAWQTHGWSALFVTHSVFESVYLSSRILVMTPRPGRIAAEILVDLPYPRSDALRTTPEFNHFCRLTSAALKQSMSASSVERRVLGD